MEQRINNLEILAIVLLVLSIIGAIIIWATMSVMEIPYVSALGSVRTTTETNPYGIALGVGVLVSGILTYFVLLVFCDMGRNLLHMRKGSNEPDKDSEESVELVKKEELI